MIKSVCLRCKLRSLRFGGNRFRSAVVISPFAGSECKKPLLIWRISCSCTNSLLNASSVFAVGIFCRIVVIASVIVASRS